MKWANIRLIFNREIRDQLRDRRTLFMVFVLPVILYPALAIGMVWLSIQGRGRLESMTYTVGVVGAERAPGLVEGDRFAADLFDGPGAAPSTRPGDQPAGEGLRFRRDQLKVVTEGVGRDDLKPERIHVLVTIPQTFGRELAEGRTGQVEIAFDSSSDRSRTARKAVLEVLERWGERLRDRRLAELGIDRQRINPVRLERQDVATPAEASASRWHRMFAFLLVVMALTGAFYPSVDLCAGEKERGTMETLLISPATRTEIVMGKYLTVWLASVATAVLNLAGMGLTAWHISSVAGNLQGGPPLAFELSAASITWMLLLLIPLAALFAACCLAMATFARSTKEGQYYLTPLFVITFPLVMITMAPGAELNALMACVPVSGSALLLKELMLGNYAKAYIYVVPVLASTTFYAYLALQWTIGLFNRESVLFREAERFDLRLWARDLVTRKQPTPTTAEAIFGFLVIVGLIYFLGSYMAAVDFRVQVLVTQLAFVLVPVAVMAAFLTTSVRRTLLLYWPGWKWLALAAGLVVVVHPLAVEFSHWLGKQIWMPPEFQKIQEKILNARAETPLVLLAVMGLAPGVCEELAFRGFILTGLLRRHPPAGAVFMSALMFGAVHLNPAQFVNGMLMGLVIGLLALRSGSILPGMLLHAAHNGLLATGATEPLLKGGSWLARTTPEGATLYSLPVLGIAALCLAVMLGVLIRSRTRVAVPAEEDR